MYLRFLHLLFALLLHPLTLPAATPLTVATYNIRYRNAADSIAGNRWPDRCRNICSLINFMQPDAFGAQEVLHSQLEDMLSHLNGYEYVGVGRDDGDTTGEYAPIFYNPATLQLIDSGHFWLSPTPSTPSLGWDAACIRICSWARLRLIPSDSIITFFNLHTDHVGVEARRNAALMVVDSVAAAAQRGDLILLSGDFNVDQTDSTYTIFTSSPNLVDAYSIAGTRYAENGTFNSFKTELHTSSRIDHIFLSPQFTVDNYAILPLVYWQTDPHNSTDIKGNDAPGQISFSPATLRLPSDHFPVFIRIHPTSK